MAPRMTFLPLVACVLLPWLGGCADAPRPAQGQAAFLVEGVAERRVRQLPPGPLYWRVENFSMLNDAQSAAGPTSLAAEISGRVWLFMGPAGDATPGGRIVAEIGPVPINAASEYLLRINRAGGPPGAATAIHTHPGAEAFYVLTGQLSQRTRHGTIQLDAGQSMPGHAPGMVMQLTSSGATDLEQLVMFVVDATKPFSSPATFD